MSDILERWRAGEGLAGVLAIDGHTHVGEWPNGANYQNVDEMVADIVRVMDTNGVDAACVMSGGYMWSGMDYTLGNDVLMELVRRVGDRVIPFAHFNPNDHLCDVLAELERVHSAGMRCIKLLNAYQDYPGDGENLMALYRFADEHNMLILDHRWDNDVLARLAREFPNTNFICGHYSNRLDGLLKEFPNVYANIWNLGSLGFLERGIRDVGPEKFLLGSDAFMNPISVGIGMVVYADIPDTHKELILGLNQARLLDEVGALPESLKNKY